MKPSRCRPGRVQANVLTFEQLEERTVPALITVMNANDAGAGSLRDAIATANTNNQDDVIVFDASVAGATINLALGELLHNDAGNALEIQGFSANQPVIDAGFTSRIFHNDATAGALTLDGLDLRNGTEGLGADGGAVFDESGNPLTIRNSIISGSFTVALNAEGGAVNATGDVSIAGSTISNNYTLGLESEGGAVFSGGNLTVAGSRITGNHTANVFSEGGAVYSGGNLTITRSMITGNFTAAGYSEGGALYAQGSVTLTNSTVENNYTNGIYSTGGAVAANGQVTLVNSSVSGNETRAGGAIGGGIYSGASVMITDGSRVDGNQIRSFLGFGFALGGGVYAYDGVTVRDSSVSSNQITGANVGYGGGIFAYDGGVTIQGSVITGNSVTGGSGGGIYSVFGDVQVLNNSTISGNIAAESGGGIGVYNATISITDSTVSNNTADNNGGGVYTYYGDVAVADSTISGNTAGDEGGGIYAYDNVTIESSVLSNNFAYDDGGGINAEGGIVIRNSLLTGNTANGDPTSGGGAANSENYLYVYDSTVSGNSAGYSGGGLYSDNNIFVRNSTISGNVANTRGGGFSVYSDSAVYNSTVTNNQAGDGGGLYVDGNLTTENSIISGNVATTNPERNVDGTTTDAFSLIGGNAGLSPLSSYGGDPVGAPGSEQIKPVHALLSGSPAINTGDPAFAGPPDFDERGPGFGRVVAGRLDIGAVEVQTADVAVTKSAVVSGSNVVTFTIVATNNGPGRTTTTVVDNFPAGVSNVAFTSTAAGGALGNTAAGTGNLNDLIDLPSGASVTYTVTATISDAVVNTVRALVPDGTVDPDLSNNVASASADLGNVFIDGRTLFAMFTPFDDVGVFEEVNGQLLVTVNGRQFGPFDVNDFDSVVVDALAGDDVIGINDPFDVTFAIDGNAGHDTLDLSAIALQTTVVIGPNAQTQHTFSSIEIVRTGPSDDAFIVNPGAETNGFLDGGGGVNTLDLSRLAYAVDIVLSGFSGSFEGLSFVNIQHLLLPLFRSNRVEANGAAFFDVSRWTANSSLTENGFPQSADVSADSSSERRSRANGSGESPIEEPATIVPA